LTDIAFASATVSPDQVPQGESASFAYTATNEGPGFQPDVTLFVAIPDGLTLRQTDDPWGVCTTLEHPTDAYTEECRPSDVPQRQAASPPGSR
jgi:hypothetical protein